MAEGHRVEDKYLRERMDKVKPGNCCTLVYTSGTTGMPKGVMISQDNYTWAKKALD
jgi:long-chain-fatty-acid--CoA ligase ACSBG